MKRKLLRNRFRMKGSYTVEAALLMGIILSVLVGILYLAFYMHDRGYIQGAAQETACAVCLHADDKTNPGERVGKQSITGRMLAVRNMAVNVSAGSKEVSVSYGGKITMPLIIRSFFRQATIPVESKVKLTTRRPSKTIQKIRGALKVIDRIRGE